MRLRRFMILLGALATSPYLLTGYELTWTEPAPLYTGPDNDVLPTALYDGTGGIWVLWIRGNPSSPFEYHIMASHYDSLGWGVPEVVTPDSLAMLTCLQDVRPYGATVDSSGNLIVAWYYGDYPIGMGRDPTWGIYMRTRSQSGWSDPELIFGIPDITPVFDIDLSTASDGDILLAWCAQGQDAQGLWVVESIYMAEKTAAGWSPIYPIVEGYGNSFMLDVFSRPRMVPDNSGGAWLTYSESYWEFDRADEHKVWACYFKDGNCSERQVISGTSNMDVGSDICMDPSGRLFVAWTSERNGTQDVYRAHRWEGSWSSPVGIATGPANQKSPAIQCDGRDIDWIAFCSGSGISPMDIQVSRAEYHEPGSFMDVLISDTLTINDHPEILVIPSGGVWVIWERSEGDDYDLYFSSTNLICGDANGDLSVTASDGFTVLNYIGSESSLASTWASDVNSDMLITASDGFAILNFLGGSGQQLNCHHID